MLEWARAMCACRERRCAERVHADMQQWSAVQKVLADAARQQRFTRVSTSAPAGTAGPVAPWAEIDRGPDAVTYKRMVQIGDRYGRCMALAFGP